MQGDQGDRTPSTGPSPALALALTLANAAGYRLLLDIKEAGYLLGSGAGRRRGEGAEKL